MDKMQRTTKNPGFLKFKEEATKSGNSLKIH